MKSLHTTDIDTHFSTEEPQELPTILAAQRGATRRRLHARSLQIEPLEERRLMTANFSDMTVEEQQATSAIVATAPSQTITNQIEQSRLLSTSALDQFFANLATELPVEHTVDTWLDTPEGQAWLSTLTQAALAHPVTLESITDIIAQAQSKRVPLIAETPSQTLQADFLLQRQLAERALTAIPVTTENTVLRTDIEKLTIPYNRSKAHHIGNGQFTFTLESTTKQVTVYVTSEYHYGANGVQSRGTKVFHLDRQQMRSSHELSAYFSGNMVRFLIVDSQDPSKKIDEIQIPFNGYAQPEAVWPEMQSGLLLQNPITPSIWVQEIRGRNVTVVYQTPYNAGSIGIPGYTQGLSTVKTQHEGGTLPTATVLTFTNLEPRTNTIELRDHTGSVIATVPLQVTAGYSGGKYTPTYSAKPEHTWNADTYAAQLDTWLPHSRATDTAQIYQEELRREQAFVHTVDAKFYPVDWGTLYQRMYSAKAGNQYGVLTKWIGPQTHTLAPFYMSNSDYLRTQKAGRPDLFAADGSVLPGKWSAAASFERNTNQYYVQYLTKIEGFMNMAAQVLADIANGESLNSPVQQAYKQYYPMGFTDIQGGYHTQDSMLQTVASILQSNQAKPMIDAWQKEADTLHGIQDTKRAQEAERALYRNERIIGDLIAKGFARNTVTTTEHTQNQARAIETFSSSQTSAKAKELATSRNYQRAQRLIAQRLESNLPASGRFKIVANYTYNSPVVVQDIETQSTVFTIRNDQLHEVANIMANATTTINDVEEGVNDLLVKFNNSSDTFSATINSSGVVTYSYFVASDTSVQGVQTYVTQFDPLAEIGLGMNTQQLQQFFRSKITQNFNTIDNGVVLTFGASVQNYINTTATSLTSIFERWRVLALKKSWYQQGASIPGLNFSLQMTEVGKIFAGSLQQYANGVGPRTVASVVHSYTGISEQEILQGLPSTEDFTVVASSLRQLFSKHGYNEIFTDTFGTPDNKVIDINTDKKNYSVSDASIKVWFDYMSSSNTVSAARIYLTNSLGNRITTFTPQVFSFATEGKKVGIEIGMNTIATYLRTLYGREVNGVFGIEVAMVNGLDEFTAYSKSIIPKVAINTGASLNANSDFDLSHRSAAEQQAITVALGLSNISTLLDSNGERTSNYFIIKQFYDRHIGPNATDPLTLINGNEWRGVEGGAGELQCKPWVQDIVMAATQFSIARNNENTLDNLTHCTSATWENSEHLIIEGGRTEAGDQFQNSLQHARSGDIVQLRFNDWPHTMIISSITSTGIWVIDSNFDSVQPDNTVRLHFLSFQRLNADVEKATIYRIPS